MWKATFTTPLGTSFSADEAELTRDFPSLLDFIAYCLDMGCTLTSLEKVNG